MPKFTLIEYQTPLKQIVLNRLYFDNKTDLSNYLKISPQSLENFIHGKITGKKRKSLNILQNIDIIRTYKYNCKSIEDVYKYGVEDLIEILIFVKKNLKQID